MQIRVSVEVPPAVCEDCYRRVMNEFTKQAKVRSLFFLLASDDVINRRIVC